MAVAATNPATQLCNKKEGWGKAMPSGGLGLGPREAIGNAFSYSLCGSRLHAYRERGLQLFTTGLSVGDFLGSALGLALSEGGSGDSAADQRWGQRILTTRSWGAYQVLPLPRSASASTCLGCLRRTAPVGPHRFQPPTAGIGKRQGPHPRVR